MDASGNRGNDLRVGGESGANGQSTGTVSLRERDPGDRRVQVVYSGRTEAPPGRTWSCFGTPDADNYIFTQCNVTGNVVTWEAVGPLNGGRADQLFVDTGIPPYRDCRAALEVLRFRASWRSGGWVRRVRHGTQHQRADDGVEGFRAER